MYKEIISEDTKQPLLAYQKQFSITKEQLVQLIEQPSLLISFGGTFGLCQSLKVDPTVGLLPDESFHPTYGILPQTDTIPFEDRKSSFGKNEIPEATMKSFLSLVWAAYNDQTLSKDPSIHLPFIFTFF
ncbi:hypothetical protein G6F57_004490 [Rhizopus arrhizus]|uniref:Uncharacterized protein n=1 Tax=Rhizopus oryzae TaxID=64495 RepID=A0A9P6XCU9_RHIOR|nr:hypothetical protein G6F22_012472 [Rhizopus arrhizus]KAG1397047.1 hypothetical protein G6F58_011598 [Rhizopus delemar]KAG0781793.1 hypothetical protein G6F21_011459 [Rhizopus arrhizus]KAG0844360.1 hypothetical protein G6F18_001947 [Rhizopus arrhizus]KAG0855388.1 hypothetical protein G6F17_005520 [Rhizopus arrhizus]